MFDELFALIVLLSTNFYSRNTFSTLRIAYERSELRISTLRTKSFMAPQAEENNKGVAVDIPEQAVKVLTVEDMYDKEKYDLSTMEPGDVFKMLE